MTELGGELGVTAGAGDWTRTDDRHGGSRLLEGDAAGVRSSKALRLRRFPAAEVRTQAGLSAVPLPPGVPAWLHGGMSRFADPARCPDCRAAITPGAAACAVCALSLQGDTAHRLFRTLTEADLLLAELRASSVPTLTRAATAAVPATAPSATGPGAFPHTADLPAYDAPAPARTAGSAPPRSPGSCSASARPACWSRRWSSSRSPGRSWAWAAGPRRWWASRWWPAASPAGWPDAACGPPPSRWRWSATACSPSTCSAPTTPAGSATSAPPGCWRVLGAVLVAAAAAGTLAVRRATGTGLVGAELVLGLGVALGVVALDLGEWLPQSASLVLGTVLALVAVLATRQARLRVAEVATAVVAGCAWLALTADALAQVADHSGTCRSCGWAVTCSRCSRPPLSSVASPCCARCRRPSGSAGRPSPSCCSRSASSRPQRT